MTVDPEFARWLREGVSHAAAADEGIEAAWGELAVETSITSPLALQADAEDEAERQLALLAPPSAPEIHDVPGRQAGLIGRTVTITVNALGYDTGLDVLVLEADETSRPGRTLLTVLRRLA